MKKLILAAMVTGSFSFTAAPAFAQDLASVTAICTATPADCAAAVSTYMAALEALGLGDEAYAAELATLVSNLVAVAGGTSNLGAIADAMAVIATSPRLTESSAAAINAYAGEIRAGRASSLVISTISVKPASGY